MAQINLPQGWQMDFNDDPNQAFNLDELRANSDAWYQACMAMRETLHLLPHRGTLLAAGMDITQLHHGMVAELYPYDPETIIAWLETRLATHCTLTPALTTEMLWQICITSVEAVTTKLYRLLNPYSSMARRWTLTPDHTAAIARLRAVLEEHLLAGEPSGVVRRSHADMIAENLVVLTFALRELEPWEWSLFYQEPTRDTVTIQDLTRLRTWLASLT